MPSLVIPPVPRPDSGSPAARQSDYTAIVSAAVNPLSTLPVTVANSSAEPSLKTLSVASDTRARFVTLLVYPPSRRPDRRSPWAARSVTSQSCWPRSSRPRDSGTPRNGCAASGRSSSREDRGERHACRWRPPPARRAGSSGRWRPRSRANSGPSRSQCHRYTARPASGEQVEADTMVSAIVSGTPSAVPLRPAKLDRMSLRTTPLAPRTSGPFDPSPGTVRPSPEESVLHAPLPFRSGASRSYRCSCRRSRRAASAATEQLERAEASAEAAPPVAAAPAGSLPRRSPRDRGGDRRSRRGRDVPCLNPSRIPQRVLRGPPTTPRSHRHCIG